MATLSQLETALVNADRAGDNDAARKLAAVINRERQRREDEPGIELSAQIPGSGGVENIVVPGTEVEPPEEKTSITDAVVGGLETTATLATGATTGLLGQIEGTIEGIVREVISGDFGSQEAANRIEKLAMDRAAMFTYGPRTETGQEFVENTGEALAPLAALPPLAETQVIANAATRIPARALIDEKIVQPGADKLQQTQELAQHISSKVKERLSKETSVPDSTVGAQQVDNAVLRQAQSDELPVPIKLTEGQKTRSFEDQRFEQETAKLPEEGKPIRDRFEEQNAQLQQNMDAFIDSTGSELTDVRALGEIVDKALRDRAAKDKTKIRSLYKEAEKSGEMESPADVNVVAKYLNDNRAERAENGIMQKVQRQIDTLEVGQGSFEDGSLILKAMTLKEIEALRRFINRNTNSSDSNDIRIASELKSLIDESTEGLGGNKYKRARAARARYAKDYENVGIIKQLLGTKRGSEDRAIAMEDVLRKSVIQPSTDLDSVRQIRRLLQTAGDEGKQAWKELQGGVLRYIKDEATKNVATNQRGDRIVSAAQLDRVIAQLDKSGKLDFVFGKKGAEQLRTVNEVAKTVLTAPPGAVNTSNTATVLAGLMDVAISGTSGVPAPIMSSFRAITQSIQDKKLKAKVRKTLGDSDGNSN